MNFVSYDHFFLVLGNKQRIHIVQLLDKFGPLCVNDIAYQLRAEQSSISHDMRRLLLCHYVTIEQKGKEHRYDINKETVRPILTAIEKHVKKNCVKGCIHWE